MAHEIVYGLNTVGNFRLLNFATGSYSCKCCVCGKEFTGDKRAVMCLECALKAVEENWHNTQHSNGAEPAEICPKCQGELIVSEWKCVGCGEFVGNP